MTRIALIGAGRVGTAMAIRLTRAGHQVHVNDIRAEVAAGLPSTAVFTTDLPTAVSGAEVVLTALPGSPELRELVTGHQLLEKLDRSTSWIDMTSAAPDVAQVWTRRAAELGIHWLDAPLGGGPDAIARGDATLYVGGDAAVIRDNQDLLASVASRIVHMGDHGTGYTAKLIINLLWFSQAIAAGEAFLLAGRTGVNVHLLQQALAGSAADSRFLDEYLPRLLAGDYAATFGLDRVVEELDALERLAASIDAPYRSGSLITAIHRAALADFGAVDGELLAVGHLERLAGVTLSSLTATAAHGSDGSATHT